MGQCLFSGLRVIGRVGEKECEGWSSSTYAMCPPNSGGFLVLPRMQLADDAEVSCLHQLQACSRKEAGSSDKTCSSRMVT